MMMTVMMTKSWWLIVRRFVFRPQVLTPSRKVRQVAAARPVLYLGSGTPPPPRVILPESSSNSSSKKEKGERAAGDGVVGKRSASEAVGTTAVVAAGASPMDVVASSLPSPSPPTRLEAMMMKGRSTGGASPFSSSSSLSKAGADAPAATAGVEAGKGVEKEAAPVLAK